MHHRAKLLIMVPNRVEVFALVFFLLLLSDSTYAANCDPWVAKAMSVQGSVERRATQSNASLTTWFPIKRDDTLCAGDIIRVNPNSRTALLLNNNTLLRLDQNTTITLSGFLAEEQSHWINLQHGIAHFIARIKKSFRVITPFVNASVEGTEFVIRVDAKQSEITVFEGKVKAHNVQGEISLTTGQTAVAGTDTAPTIVLKVKPRDAVQWSLYYPAIVNYDALLFDHLEADYKSVVEQSIAAAQAGNISKAIARIELLPSQDINLALLSYRATLYLSVGRIELAKQDIQHIIHNQTDHAQAIALQAIIAIVQNDKAFALSLAEQAMILQPDGASPALALSYVYQSMFDINSALQLIQMTASKHKDNALLWSRLSELYLMVGERSQAVDTAKQAKTLNPHISRTHSVLGFAYLSKIKVKKAEQAFKDAIERDDTDPLSRLGLGLALIRQGNLVDGRQQIEFAASLDPNNALVRSYLGKAYYEEKRENLAASQYEMAKQLDPQDPTAYYYDAILKQSINRPIEALQDIQKSIKLNNNHAVYQSQLKLDQDEAARSASMARIYNDVGFGQLALLEGWKSLNVDPGNSSAHRLLADNYSNLPRHEIARVSELLQAQLLQPINLSPIQPQLAVSDLGILDGTGPSNPSYSEFNPMFTRNNIGLQFNGIFGNQGTKGDDLVVSGIYDWLSYSLGQFYYKTDGFRPNNDLEHKIYNAFVQASVTDNFSIQAEIRNEDTESGDLLLQFDPNIFKMNKRQKIDKKIERIGFHYKPAVRHDVIGSFIKANMDEDISDFKIDTYPSQKILTEDTVTYNTKSLSSEIQYMYDSLSYKIIMGVGNVDLERNDITNTIYSSLSPKNVLLIDGTEKSIDTDHLNIYLYNILEPFPDIFFTIGLSYDSIELEKYKNYFVNPKIGTQINIGQNTLIRVAAFSTVKRPLSTNQTIEPTNIAGFNQFFDDINSTESKRVGAALEHRFSSTLNTGIELSWRYLDVPVINSETGKAVINEFNEQAHRAYLYWAFTKDFSLTFEYNFEYMLRDSDNTIITPRQLKTKNLPIGIKYISSNRLSASVLTTIVEQNYEDKNKLIQDSTFLITNFLISYRFPKRIGILSFGVNNLFNETFNYYELEITGSPRLPLYQPSRTLFTRFTLSF